MIWTNIHIGKSMNIFEFPKNRHTLFWKQPVWKKDGDISKIDEIHQKPKIISPNLFVKFLDCLGFTVQSIFTILQRFFAISSAFLSCSSCLFGCMYLQQVGASPRQADGYVRVSGGYLQVMGTPQTRPAKTETSPTVKVTLHMHCFHLLLIQITSPTNNSQFGQLLIDKV